LGNKIIMKATTQKDSDSYEAFFTVGDSTDYEKNKEKAMSLYDSLFKSEKQSSKLENQKQIETKEEEIPIIPTINLNEDEDEVKIEDVPF